ncbi:MAG: hypothetical protein UV29_C0041G0009, partial [Candidatus Collierbacteria bacterium GW2011_GWD2_42_50]
KDDDVSGRSLIFFDALFEHFFGKVLNFFANRGGDWFAFNGMKKLIVAD